MKHKTIKYLAALTLAAGVTSCSDFLDQTSSSSFDDKNIFSSYELAEGTIANIYNEFGQQNYRARSVWYGYNTDIEFYNSSDKGDGKSQLATYSALTSNDQMNNDNGTDLWAKMYAAIEKANLAIEGMEANASTESAEMYNLLGEAYTLRALVYIDLINMWGDVPARFESLNSDNMFIPRTDRDVIYKQLIQDLQKAATLCAWPNEITATQTVERVNKAFVKGLLARVCLQAAGYAQRADGENRRSTDPELTVEKLYPIALQACKDVIESNTAKLKGNFEDILNNNGISGDVITAGSESLFEIGYSNDPMRGRIMYTFGIKHNSEDDFTSMKQGSQVGPVATLFWEYDKNDSRRDVTCCPFQWNKGAQVLQSAKSWSFGKYRYEWTNRAIKSGNDDGINKLYMRYADVLLMAAEAANELGDLASAKTWLKMVRQRAVGSVSAESYIQSIGSKDDMFKAIQKERALEFAGELVRKADLIRWGLLKTNMDIAKQKLTALANLTDYDADHTYSQLGGKLYYKMEPYAWKRGENSYTTANAKLKIYGLEYGETDYNSLEGYESYKDSAGDETNWLKANALDDQINYLYLNDPDKRQYWPIFNVNLNANEQLKNYEWYE